MDTIARVLRVFCMQAWSVRRITRELQGSWTTIRKILRSDETDFSYERSRQPLPRIGPWQEQFERFLSTNADKPSREGLTLIRIFEALRGLGYEGGYDAVRRFARTWTENRGTASAEAYVPLSYAPGGACQFDWSHEAVLISGVTVTVKVAHVRLCHSRMMFARANMRESQEMVFDAHDRAFAFIRGACTRGIYDSEAWPPWVRGPAERRRWSRRSSPAGNGSTIAAFSRYAAISWFSRSPAPQPRAAQRLLCRGRGPPTSEPSDGSVHRAMIFSQAAHCAQAIVMQRKSVLKLLAIPKLGCVRGDNSYTSSKCDNTGHTRT